MREKEFILSAPGEYTILEGETLPLLYPEKIQLTGDINSITHFLAKRYKTGEGAGIQHVDPSKVVLVIDERGMVIKMMLDPEALYSTTVTGKLEFSPELLKFMINTEKRFSRETLVKLFRFNRRFFTDKLRYDELVRAYQTLEIKTTGEIKNKSDNRGNRDLGFNKVVNSENVPESFILTVPIFKGFPDESFRVDICLDVTESTVEFWFESVDLIELIEVRRSEIFAAALELTDDFVKIYQ